MEHVSIYLILACVFGFFMAWGIGANDIANAMGTSVGSKIFTLKQAILVAAIFEFLGAYLAGGAVTQTISGGITDPSLFTKSPELLIYGMLASLLAAGIWLSVATHFGWPVSTTHSIIGAIVGFASVELGVNAVHWGKIGSIIVSWLLSPVLGGSVSFIIFTSIKKFILDAEDPVKSAKKYMPIYIFILGFVISMITLNNGLGHLGLHLTYWKGIGYSCLTALLLTALSRLLFLKIRFKSEHNKHDQFVNVEKIFGILMIFTACSMTFAHGSNDVANAVGPLAAIVTILKDTNQIGGHVSINNWVLLLGATGIVIGLATYGYKVINTIGKNITELTPSRGFSAEISAAVTVIVASGSGLPISTTHTLVGAILGVGFARGIGALNLKVINKIFMSWVITLPVGAVLAIIFFNIFKFLHL